MFSADEEDVSLRTPPVRPNDILDIEVSPINRFTTPASHLIDGEHKEKPDTVVQNSRGTKEKKEKAVKTARGNSKQRRRSESPMKRGDPFLPSVISDENPFVDYPVRKVSRKKPSDCKCKGTGYNLSPSALLPEEMRQQWGVGVFGKPTPPKSKPVVSPCHTITSRMQLVGPREVSAGMKVVSTSFSEQPRSSIESDVCPMCITDQCSCAGRAQEGFRIPDKSDKRYTKTRAGSGKLKDGRFGVDSKNTSSTMKRIACYSYKENRNIISTSNFSKHNGSCKILPENSYTPSSFETGFYKTSIANARYGTHATTLGTMDFNKPYTGRCGDLTPKEEVRNITKPRRILANITPPSALANSASHLSNIANAYETSKSLSRTAKQMMLMNGNQTCSCPSCRRPNTFLSRMEALTYSSGQAQHNMFSPIVFPTSQRYGSSSTQSSLPQSHGRYAPYPTRSFGYTRTNDSFYTPSSDLYRCSSPSYDYDTPYYRGRDLTPLSMAHEMSKLDTSFSFIDTDMPELSSMDETKDITDLSIKDTVDFFIGMKSPFVTSSPSALSDTSSNGAYNAMSPDEESYSPCYPGNPASTCLCPIGSCPGAFSGVGSYRDYSCGDQNQRPIYPDHNPHQPAKNATTVNTRSGQPSTMPLLYSSLVSDLEVELRSAIENIPTE